MKSWLLLTLLGTRINLAFLLFPLDFFCLRNRHTCYKYLAQKNHRVQWEEFTVLKSQLSVNLNQLIEKIPMEHGYLVKAC